MSAKNVLTFGVCGIILLLNRAGREPVSIRTGAAASDQIKKGSGNMNEKHGNLSINSDNIFPIIKKWLYSDHDIFFRELVSNGCDAITKLRNWI